MHKFILLTIFIALQLVILPLLAVPNTEIAINGNLVLTSGRDTALEGAVITADSATLDIGRDLTIVSQVDTVEGSNSSKGFNASLSIGAGNTSSGGSIQSASSGASFGITGGKGSESKVWVVEPSGILVGGGSGDGSGATNGGYKSGTLDIKVVRGTQITGGVIASYSNDLSLETETLVTKDIALHDNKRQLDGSVGVNVGVNSQGGGSGEGSAGADGGNINGVSKPGITIEGKYANREVEGIAKATIGEGKVEVRSQTEAETKTQLAAINRDPDAVIEVTSFKDEGFELYISDTAVSAAFEGVKIIGRALDAIASDVFSNAGKRNLDLAAVGNALNSGDLTTKDLALQLASCGTRQGFNLLDVFSTSRAYAAGNCEVRDKSGQLIRQLSTKSKEDCLDILSVLLASKERRIDAFGSDGEASLVAGLRDFFDALGRRGAVLQNNRAILTDENGKTSYLVDGNGNPIYYNPTSGKFFAENQALIVEDGAILATAGVASAARRIPLRLLRPRLGGSRSLGDFFSGGGTPKASELKLWAEAKGWKPTQSASGPLTYIDSNGVKRLTIKRGSGRAPGSDKPHVEVRDASGQRIDPTTGKPTTRKDPVGNHRPIDYDL